MLATPSLNRLPRRRTGHHDWRFPGPDPRRRAHDARLRHIALVCVGAAFIALTANVTVWLHNNPVPMTGQTLAVLLVGGALGLRRGALSVALYLARDSGCRCTRVTPTASRRSRRWDMAGSSWARRAATWWFPAAAPIVGKLAELGWDRHIPGAVGAMVIGEVVIYAVGVPWLAVAAHFSPELAIQKGLLPFVLGDALKLAIAAVLFPSAWCW